VPQTSHESLRLTVTAANGTDDRLTDGRNTSVGYHRRFSAEFDINEGNVRNKITKKTFVHAFFKTMKMSVNVDKNAAVFSTHRPGLAHTSNTAHFVILKMRE